ncbi:hypothetical protein HNP55_004571 [Paucibacter oligotrophus]|uniref:RiboL-PSP-HEPN domain-containing protein n=1 Tax=Roseateles oligotrophus TaxID=1769250 RepID=A0A840LL42_9BURK|nr:hypothetical protein [Roseateles oligotrophus]MBB4846017.1 hypothetical protein [Roseateles oligotrophus]
MSIRHLSVLKNLDQVFDTYDLDEFRDLFTTSLSRREADLTKASSEANAMASADDEHAEGYASHLEDRWMMLKEVSDLSCQLLIVALFRQTELHIKRVVGRTIPSANPSSLFQFKALKGALPFPIESVANFNAFNELRMLNNAVKHQGVVSQELSSNFPVWIVGEALTGLDAAYERLKPAIAGFIASFVVNCYGTKTAP